LDGTKECVLCDVNRSKSRPKGRLCGNVLLMLQEILKSFNYSRAFGAGAILAATYLIYDKIINLLIFKFILVPLYNFSPSVSSVVAYIIALPILFSILAISIVIFFKTEKVNLFQSVLLGAVFVVWLYLYIWLENRYYAIFADYRYHFSFGLIDVLVLIAATVFVTAAIRYVWPSLLAPSREGGMAIF